MEQVEWLRDRYRPTEWRILFVGESAPASGKFFYRANSGLFYAMREAFATERGDKVPYGQSFLKYFQDSGCWLFDLASTPVNQGLSNRQRRAIVAGGVPRLTELIKEVQPTLVVGVKLSLETMIRQATSAADMPTDRVHLLPFPNYQWRRLFVDGVAALVRDLPAPESTAYEAKSPSIPLVGDEPPNHPAPQGRAALPTVSSEGGGMTLHEAMKKVLRVRGPMTTKDLAREVASQDLYRRGDGGHAPASQVRARVGQYSDLVTIEDGKVHLNASK